ncbi:hypothetical protein AX16_009660 [Volvariella volvacea WC 439]|nr:hypothetical protein AX16_009660 [Volvariella volvacea WC 439]
MATPRHDFYESDERLTISIYERNAPPEQVDIKFEPRKLSFQYNDKVLVLDPLKGEIDPEKSDFTVGKPKIEIRLVKRLAGRWGGLTGELATASAFPPTTATAEARAKRKNWDGITTDILSKEKDKTTEEDPNVGGDAALNSFFQQIYKDADEDTKKAMMKSYMESGGTTLSTNWDEVKKARVEVKPPEGAEWKKWN